MKILVTGGAGFIGGALVRYLIDKTDHEIFNIDKLTYAGNLTSLTSVKDNDRYQFARIDICDQKALSIIFDQFKPDAVMHLAAESHVDRSIAGAEAFIETNIIGTYRLLEQSRHYWQALSPEKKSDFRFHHISTDEVYGDLDENKENRFLETTPYAPSSPYSASKASSDHLVRAWHRTYGLPVLVTNCSNNYGPYQFPEKLIPLVILNALNQKPVTIYGSGLQIRDWLYVEDHVEALYQVLTTGKIGETYNIGGNNEKTNLEVVQTILTLLEKIRPNKSNDLSSYQDLIIHTKDRPGHDQRYAINCEKIKKELGFEPKTCFEEGLEKTIHWYLNNQAWIQSTETKESDLVLS